MFLLIIHYLRLNSNIYACACGEAAALYFLPLLIKGILEEAPFKVCSYLHFKNPRPEDVIIYIQS